MKILILTNNLGGLHNFRKEVVQALIDDGHQLTISGPLDNNIQFWENVACEYVPTQFNTKSTNPFNDIKLLFSYIRIIKKTKPDAVLTYTIKPNIYGGMACRLLGKPQLANITGLGTAVENEGKIQKLSIFLYKIGLKKTHTVFFQNEANKDFCLSHKIVQGRYVLIPGSGVNLQHHQFQEYPAESPIRFIFISRLIKEKGIEQYLDAAEHIKKAYPQTEFHILGFCGGCYQERIDILQKKGTITYHGKQKDIRPYLGMSHCTIHPSFYPEGMSNVLLESCAAGRPIITTDRPGCGEVVDDGINGFVVKQRDSEDLIEKVEKFVHLPYETKKAMGIEARKKVEREFDRTMVTKAYIDELERLKK